ncbi:TPA: hypothetical protein HA225_04130 [Candidatus Micrarchaeota archaeon]|nr:hypothetical protein [Candidatus Micrarchaeota archaeon]HIH30114.1 hypothetical protein [Candidatus Micrarchaeota archaeon]
MYHPGKVIAVLSPKEKGVLSSDSSVQATMKMWDDNVLTMAVEPKIAPKIRVGDIVLADYRPEKGMSVPVPRNTIVKILRGNSADKMWATYREVHEKRKGHEKREKEAQQSYIG